jgi:hypothetical protein
VLWVDLCEAVGVIAKLSVHFSKTFRLLLGFWVEVRKVVLSRDISTKIQNASGLLGDT